MCCLAEYCILDSNSIDFRGLKTNSFSRFLRVSCDLLPIFCEHADVKIAPSKRAEPAPLDEATANSYLRTVPLFDFILFNSNRLQLRTGLFRNVFSGPSDPSWSFQRESWPVGGDRKELRGPSSYPSRLNWEYRRTHSNSSHAQNISGEHFAEWKFQNRLRFTKYRNIDAPCE